MRKYLLTLVLTIVSTTTFAYPTIYDAYGDPPAHSNHWGLLERIGCIFVSFFMLYFAYIMLSRKKDNLIQWLVALFFGIVWGVVGLAGLWYSLF